MVQPQQAFRFLRLSLRKSERVCIDSFLINKQNIRRSIFDDKVKMADNSTTINPEDAGTTSVESSDVVTCKQGLTVGYMLIRQPNISSVVYTGTKYNVSWDYSVAVTSPPSFIDAYIQYMAPGIRTTWKNKIASNVSASSRQFWWEPKSLVDGKYKLRLVPDGKETYDVPANQLPCFADGESIPSVSATFKVYTPKTMTGEFPEKFPPSSGNEKGVFLSTVMLWGWVIIFLYMYKTL